LIPLQRLHHDTPSRWRVAHGAFDGADFVVRTLTGETTRRRMPQMVQFTKPLDSYGQTFVSDSTHAVLAWLTMTIPMEAPIRPGLYRLIDYEMVLEDALDNEHVMKHWNPLFCSSMVFPREKYAMAYRLLPKLVAY
jgi:hypothetical protein